MTYSGYRPLFSHRLHFASGALLLIATALLSACSSDYRGKTCAGKVETLSGQPVAMVEGKVIDRFNSFSVTLPEREIDSGPLHSSDRRLYVPSSVTSDGWMAQRVSDQRFTLINAPDDRAITLICPNP